jgi:phosphate transport system substrate-binding protein
MKKIILASALISAAVASAQVNTITGSGASFPFLLYSEMFSVYKGQSGVAVNYQSIGSGGGQRAILGRTVDFAGSDAPLTDDQLKSAPGKIVHIPMALGAVVPTYNIPGVTTNLKFSGAVLADIYLGKIKNWNEKAIQDLNKTVKLPNLPITVVYRSDGSGTTSIWVDYLAKVSSQWRTQVSNGAVTSVKWPVGVGGPQNAGVAGLVKQTPGSIGYVELLYATSNKLEYGLVRNGSGKFVDAGNLKELEIASDSKVLPDDTRVSITNSDIGYPVTGFTWLLAYEDQKYGNRTKAQAQALVKMFDWALTDGQKIHNKLGYGQIDGSALVKAKRIVSRINYGGEGL